MPLNKCIAQTWHDDMEKCLRFKHMYID